MALKTSYQYHDYPKKNLQNGCTNLENLTRLLEETILLFNKFKGLYCLILTKNFYYTYDLMMCTHTYSLTRDYCCIKLVLIQVSH